MLLSMGSLRFMKNMITDLATMDVRKMEKPLFSGALGDVYQKLRQLPELQTESITHSDKSNSTSSGVNPLSMKKASANLIPRLRLDPAKFGTASQKNSGHIMATDMILEDSLMEDQFTPYNNSTVKNLMDKSVSGSLRQVGSKDSISHRSEKEALAAKVMGVPTSSKHSAADLVNYMDEYEPQRTDLDLSKAKILAHSPRLYVEAV